MLHLTTVTLFHTDWDADAGLDTTSKQEFQAHWYEHTVTSPQAGGLQYTNECKVRIPTTDTLTVSTGDRVYKRQTDSENPPKAALTVVGFSDNRKGVHPHWLVMAK